MTQCSDLVQWIGNVIVLSAFGAALWYSWETRKMRLQMIRPKLVFLTPPHVPEHLSDMVRLDLIVRNVGDGTAINVTIERAQDQEFKLWFEPEHIPVLQKGEQAQLTMRPGEGDYQPDMNLILDERPIALKITAKYVDVDGAVSAPQPLWAREPSRRSSKTSRSRNAGSSGGSCAFLFAAY